MSSRNPDGNVPNAYWNDDKFQVNYYNPSNANDNLRSRGVIPMFEPHHCVGLNFNNYFKYFIQPLAIFESSCKSVSKRIYCFCSTIFSS